MAVRVIMVSPTPPAPPGLSRASILYMITYLHPDLKYGPGIGMDGYQNYIRAKTLAGAHQAPMIEQGFSRT